MLSEKLQVPVMVAENPSKGRRLEQESIKPALKQIVWHFLRLRRLFSSKKVVMNPTAI